MPKESRRVQMTKRILKESLLELLEQQSIHKISIRELCEIADINRSTFYKYYDSQYDLLREMENDLLQKMESIIIDDAMYNYSDNHLEKMLQFIKENLKLCQILINPNADADFQRQILELPSILECMQQLMSDFGEAEFSYAKTMILYGGYYIVEQWIESDCKESPKEMQQIIMSFVRRITLV